LVGDVLDGRRGLSCCLTGGRALKFSMRSPRALIACRILDRIREAQAVIRVRVLSRSAFKKFAVFNYQDLVLNKRDFIFSFLKNDRSLYIEQS